MNAAICSLVFVVVLGAPMLAAVPGQIVPAAGHPQWLARTDGRPVFICGPGDPEDFLYLGTRQSDGTRAGGGQEGMIQRLISQGGNSIYMQMIRSSGGDGAPDHNPFVNGNMASGLDQDILNQWEGWFTAMDNAGIVIFLFFYDDSACTWGCSSTVQSVPDDELAFINAIVARFKHHRNLIWVHAEEFQERFSLARAKSFVAAIRAADDNAHVIAVHQVPGLELDLADDPNVDQFALQYGNDSSSAAGLNNAMNTAWNNAEGRYNNNMSEIPYGGLGTGASARKKIWAMAMGGSYVMANGWRLSGSSDPPDSNLRECRWLQQTMESVPLQDLAPANSRKSGDTDYVLASDTSPNGASYVLYSDGYVSGIGLNNLPSGTYRERWLDTVTGTIVTRTLNQPVTGTVTLVRPAGLGTATEVAVSLSRCVDTDGDGVCAYADNCPSVSNSNQANTDGDTLGNVCDPCPSDPLNDADGDGICGNSDTCADDSGNDIDDDGVCGDVDNCPSVANANQANSDGDGLGNACDTCPLDPANDADHDGDCGNVDNCVSVANPNQADSDGDGVGDACEGRVLITEVHYDQGSDLEFMELLSVDAAKNITGWSVSDQDSFTLVFDVSDSRFPCATPFVLGAGERVSVIQGSGTAVCTGPSRRVYLNLEAFLSREGDDILLRSADGACQDYVAFESSVVLNAPPPDCAWNAPNATNEDESGVSLSRFDASPVTDTNSGLDWEPSGETSTIGPSSRGAANEPVVDTDGDGVIDSVDTCPTLASPFQSDFDGDGQGDRCDSNDGVISLYAASRTRFEWMGETGQTSWNRYRGDLAVLRSQGIYTQNPASVSGAKRDCGLSQALVNDSDTPPSGKTYFSLVTGKANGVEGGLGSNSAGVARPNVFRCP